MRSGFGERVGDLGRVLVAGDPVDGRAQPRTGRRCGPHAADLLRGRLERAARASSTAPSVATTRYAATSATRWLTTRLEPPGGIDTP